MKKNGWGVPAATIRGVGGLLSIPIQAIGIYIAMQNFKKVNGWLTYGQALKTGVTVAITIAVIVAIFSFLYCKVFNPGFRGFYAEGCAAADAGQWKNAGTGTKQLQSHKRPVYSGFAGVYGAYPASLW